MANNKNNKWKIIPMKKWFSGPWYDYDNMPPRHQWGRTPVPPYLYGFKSQEDARNFIETLPEDFPGDEYVVVPEGKNISELSEVHEDYF